jgi:hypothetical protein
MYDQTSLQVDDFELAVESPLPPSKPSRVPKLAAGGRAAAAVKGALATTTAPAATAAAGAEPASLGHGGGGSHQAPLQAGGAGFPQACDDMLISPLPPQRQQQPAGGSGCEGLRWDAQSSPDTASPPLGCPRHDDAISGLAAPSPAALGASLEPAEEQSQEMEWEGEEDEEAVAPSPVATGRRPSSCHASEQPVKLAPLEEREEEETLPPPAATTGRHSSLCHALKQSAMLAPLEEREEEEVSQSTTLGAHEESQEPQDGVQEEREQQGRDGGVAPEGLALTPLQRLLTICGQEVGGGRCTVWHGSMGWCMLPTTARR